MYSNVGNPKTTLRSRDKFFIMFNRVKPLVFAVSLFSFSLLSSCQKSKNPVGAEKQTTKSEQIFEVQNSPILLKELDSSYLSERMFTDAEIDTIGVMHNSLLSECFSTFDFNTNEPANEFITQFNNHAAQYNLSFQNLSFSTNVDSMVNALENHLSNTAFLYVIQIKNEAENIVNVATFNNKINQIESNIRANTAGKETDVLLTLCSVIKRSAYFWSSPEIGGSGEGYQIIENLIPETQSYGIKGESPRDRTRRIARAVGWALISDGFSASMGSIGIAIACITTGPPGWVGLTWVYGSAVLASAFSAFISEIRK